MKSPYYEEYFQLERTHWWFFARKKILHDQLSKLLKGDLNLKILNVGAAFGASSILLQDFGKVTSVEINSYCCEFVKEKYGMEFINASITDLPFNDNEFDLVCAFDVVEHVEGDSLAIQELHRVCKLGGYTFTTVPAFKFLWSDHDRVNEHRRRYTKKNYTQLFSSTPSQIIFSTYFNFFLFPAIAFYRLVSSLFKRRAKNAVLKSDFSLVNNNTFSKIFYSIFKSESFYLKKGWRFPFGISLMVISQKSQ